MPMKRLAIKCKNLLMQRNEREIIYTRNATEAINLVAYSWGLANLQAGDENYPHRGRTP